MSASDLPQVVVIFGPTAVGKTPLAIELARRVDGEIISADSRQVYRYLDIGTAKPTPEERAQAPHHLIDYIEPDEQYDAERWARDAAEAAKQIAARGRLPLVVGGAGFYIAALLEGLEPIPKPPREIEERLLAEAESEGIERLHERLREVDPQRAADLHPHNTARIVRALAVFEATGRPISEHYRAAVAAPRATAPVVIALHRPREELHERIDRRTEEMLSRGLVKEVAQLWERYGALPALDGPGYVEIIRFLTGERSLGQAVREIKRNTRRYAKRQMTWARGRLSAEWIEAGAGAEAVERALASTSSSRTATSSSSSGCPAGSW